MKQEYQDQIDKYVLGQMDEAEKSSFEQIVAADAEIQEQLQFTQEVASATKSREEKLAMMQKWEDDYEWEDHGIGKRQYLYWISGIAAIFIVGFFLTHHFMGSKDNLMFDPSSIEYRAMRSGENYANIEKLLVDKNYEDALKQIGIEEAKLVDQRTATDSISDEERRTYNQMLIQEKADELSWMKVYALLGIDRREGALQLLDQLRHSEGEYMEKADSLYLIIYK